SIAPIFKTRSAQETLLKWTGNNSDYHSYIQKYWEKNIFSKQEDEKDFTNFWNKTLHDGAVEFSMMKPAEDDKKDKNKKPEKQKEKVAEEKVEPQATIADCASTINNNAKGGEWELVIYEKTGIGSGVQ